MLGKLNRITKEELLAIVKETTNLNTTLERVGLSKQNTNRKKLKEVIEKFNIDITHFERQERKLENERFGFLTVREKVLKKGKSKWICECECGENIEAYEYKLLSGSIKSCGCQHFQIGSKNHFWKGYEEISGRYLDNLKRGAKIRNIPYEVTEEYLWKLFIDTNRKCNLSGLYISFGSSYRAKDQTASLDRIDNSKGYIEGNVQWIHKDINRMKNVFSQEYFVETCKKIAAYN